MAIPSPSTVSHETGGEIEAKEEVEADVEVEQLRSSVAADVDTNDLLPIQRDGLLSVISGVAMLLDVDVDASSDADFRFPDGVDAPCLHLLVLGGLKNFIQRVSSGGRRGRYGRYGKECGVSNSSLVPSSVTVGRA